MSKTHLSLVPIERIENRIFLIRGKKVMLDRNLAELYGITTGNLNLAVKRNRNRFPDDDFMFQLTKGEFNAFKFLILQNEISKRGTRKSSYACVYRAGRGHAFIGATEHRKNQNRKLRFQNKNITVWT